MGIMRFSVAVLLGMTKCEITPNIDCDEFGGSINGRRQLELLHEVGGGKGAPPAPVVNMVFMACCVVNDLYGGVGVCTDTDYMCDANLPNDCNQADGCTAFARRREVLSDFEELDSDSDQNFVALDLHEGTDFCII